MIYRQLANVTLALHVAFVAAVVALLPLVFVGGWRGWRWVRNGWIRIAHLAGIGIVVAQAWAGVVCPLTTLEMWLRRKGGETVYEGSFIQHWMERILYYDAPEWVFTASYTAFAAAVLLSWALVPPRFARRSSEAHS